MRLIGVRRARCGAVRLLAATGLLLTAAVVVAGPASAHDELLNATPRDGATVDQLPSEIQLAFDRSVLPDLSVVRVTGPGGEALATGTPTVAGTVVTQRTAGRAPAGDYRLAYRVVSADGHPVTGGWTFTVRRGATVGGPDVAADTESPTGGGPSGLGLLGLGAALVALGTALALRARLVRRAATTDHEDVTDHAPPAPSDRLPVGG